MFKVEFTESAVDDLRYLKKFEQTWILDEIESLLSIEPHRQSRNKKPLRPNDLSTWELRIDRFRVFYDLDTDTLRVKIKAIGWKEHERLIIRGMEYKL